MTLINKQLYAIMTEYEYMHSYYRPANYHYETNKSSISAILSKGQCATWHSQVQLRIVQYTIHKQFHAGIKSPQSQNR